MNSKITKIVADYVDHIEFDVSHVDMSQVRETWIKWGTLNLEMKDGSRISIDGSELEGDYKWPIEKHFYDEDYNHLEEGDEEE